VTTLNGVAALIGFATFREEQFVAYTLMVAFAVIMHVELSQGSRQWAWAKQDQL
jgi:hypothetical protein